MRTYTERCVAQHVTLEFPIHTLYRFADGFSGGPRTPTSGTIAKSQWPVIADVTPLHVSTIALVHYYKFSPCVPPLEGNIPLLMTMLSAATDRSVRYGGTATKRINDLSHRHIHGSKRPGQSWVSRIGQLSSESSSHNTALACPTSSTEVSVEE